MVMNDMTDDGKAVLQTIDWQAPIEAVHEDGRVVAAGPFNEGREQWPDDEGQYHIISENMLLYANEDGSNYFPQLHGGKWRIRNVQPARQTQTLTAQEHLARMEALVRSMASYSGTMFRNTEWVNEARALVAEMDPVVDAGLIEAREVCAEAAIRAGQTSQVDEYRNGKWDHGYSIDVAKLGLKRGRELARGEG